MLNNIFKKTIGVLLFCLALGAGTQLMAQVISGKVTDKSGDTLPGANVVVKGTTNGTVTDFDGNYRLEVNTTDAILLVSFLGYQTLEIPTNGRSVIDVVLESDVASLDEVVVIGYGTQRRRDLTGSVSSVSAEQLSDVPVSSVAQVLTGRLAGVQITTAEGSPDAEVRIRVRGGGSITQDNSPLYIVDGFPADNINSIAPTDIQSIDVLKDASSTAIYGARGANGVVIITTKSGKAGKTQVSYNFYYGQKYLAKKLDVMSPYEYALYQYERSRINFMERKSFSERMGEWDELTDLYGDAEATDWQQEVFGQQAPSVYHNISVSGGSEQSTYNLSVTRQSDTGIMINSGFERTNLGFRFDTKATDKLTINFDVKYADTKTLGSGTSDSGTETTNR
ncbi:MAG: SusC/RagA family TonB-linked outer membrane protein, partial [Prolixibacteraceae bacterium]|nr:SusC/RagA family TonB-linked outer membrane protein [Prolixibacteraceae bacterium]